MKVGKGNIEEWTQMKARKEAQKNEHKWRQEKEVELLRRTKVEMELKRTKKKRVLNI
jgi:hypothetical protein